MRHATRRRFLISAAGMRGASPLRAQQRTPPPAVDHHQHLFGPLTQSLAPTIPRIGRHFERTELPLKGDIGVFAVEYEDKRKVKFY